MSWTQTGSCPKCGAPIYAPTFSWSIIPPPPHYTCNCVPRNVFTSTNSTNIGPS